MRLSQKPEFSPAIIEMPIMDDSRRGHDGHTMLPQMIEPNCISSFSSATFGSDPSIIEHRLKVQYLTELQR
jgi:hypothetical protein